MSALSSEAAAQLQQRQEAILHNVQQLENKLAKLQIIIAQHAATQATQGANKPKQTKAPAAAADKAAQQAASKKPAAANGAPSASSSPPATALQPQSDDDPSRWWDAASYTADTTGVVPRLSALATELGFSKYRFYRVSSDYYNWQYEERQAAMKLPSTQHLFKSVVMANSARREVDESGRPYLANPQFTCVLSSYTDKLHKEGLARAMWQAHADATAKANAAGAAGPDAAAFVPYSVLPKKAFNLRLAPEEEAVALTGYQHNAMTPLGLAKPEQLPFLLSDTALKLEGGSMALGGGEVDVKWRVSVKQFIDVFKPIVAHVVA